MRLIVGETPAVLQQYRLLKDLDKEGANRFFDLIKRLSGASARVNRHHSAPVKHGVWVRGKTHSSGLLQAQFQKDVDALCKGDLVVEWATVLKEGGREDLRLFESSAKKECRASNDFYSFLLRNSILL